MIPTKEDLIQKYIGQKMSDKEIGIEYGVSRPTITLLRRKYQIPSRNYCGESGQIGENIVALLLKRLGYDVLDMNQEDPHSIFDLMVNGFIRIEVKTACIDSESKWNFTLSSPGTFANEEIYLKNGPATKSSKDFSKTCDFIILCGLSELKTSFFVIPSSITLPKSTLTIYSTNMGKWAEWLGRFELIKEFIDKRLPTAAEV